MSLGSNGKTQMEKDFELIKHEGTFDEYLEMGKKISKP